MVAGMYLDHNHRNIGINILDRLLEVLAYDHAGAGSNNPDTLRMPEVDDLFKKRREQFAPAKDKVGLVHRGCDNPQVVFFEQAGVFE
jgi:hypothetical protein